MMAIEHLTIAVPAKMAAKVRDWVADGDFPDIDSAVLAALLALEARQTGTDAGAEDDVIRQAVQTALAEYDADPSTGSTADEVRQYLATRRAGRQRKAA